MGEILFIFDLGLFFEPRHYQCAQNSNQPNRFSILLKPISKKKEFAYAD
jgi:hypothetical protein